MGIRIHQAIGYGIEFNESTRELLMDDFRTEIWETDIMDRSIKDFFMHKYRDFVNASNEEKSKIFNSEKIGLNVLFLLKNFEDENYSSKASNKSYCDCINIVANTDDEPTGLLFIPPSQHDWKRYDDSIDYAFNVDKDMELVFEPLSSKYPSMGLYPYPAFEKIEADDEMNVFDIAFMDNQIDKSFSEKLKKDKIIRNFIPEDLKDIIEDSGIFKNKDDMYLLKPYKAVWWS